MDKAKKIEAYFAKEDPFKNAINSLRKLAKKTEAIETLKWGMPVYTLDGKNVFGVIRFKHHFGIWFYNGAFMDDPKNLLQNAQEGKTKAMRGWKMKDENEIDEQLVLAYLEDAIRKQKEGKVLKPAKPNNKFEIPELLRKTLNDNNTLKDSFSNFTPFRQKEFCEYITEAKQEKTKLKRLEKIIPMIQEGIGLNDKYR